MEEFDYLSNELSINTLTLTAYDPTGGFDMLNESSIYNKLLENQEIRCAVKITDNEVEKEVPMGVFYLSGWESVDRNSMKLSAGDIISKFDKMPMKNSKIVTTKTKNEHDYPIGTPLPVTDWFEDIFQKASFQNYEIDNMFSNIYLSGYVKTGTIRTALQDLCIAAQAVLRVDTYGTIHVYQPDIKPEPDVQKVQKRLNGIISDIKVSDPRKNKIDGFATEYFECYVDPDKPCLPTVMVMEPIDDGEFHHIKIDVTDGYMELEHPDKPEFAISNLSAPLFFDDDIRCCYFDGSMSPTYLYNLTVKNIQRDLNSISFDCKLTYGWLDGVTYIECGASEIATGISVWNQNADSKENSKISGNTLISKKSLAEIICGYWYDFLNRYNMTVETRAILIPAMIMDIARDPEETDKSRFDSVHAGESVRIADKNGRDIDIHITSIDLDLAGGMLAKLKGITSKEDIHVAATKN